MVRPSFPSFPEIFRRLADCIKEFSFNRDVKLNPSFQYLCLYSFKGPSKVTSRVIEAELLALISNDFVLHFVLHGLRSHSLTQELKGKV